MGIRKLTEEETLDWHDLWRRLKANFPDVLVMLDAYRDWKYWRDKMATTYHNIDCNANGRVTKAGVQASMKAARKAWKRKH